MSSVSWGPCVPVHGNQPLLLPDRKIVLPGNFLSFAFYLRPLELHVLGVQGADGVALRVQQGAGDREAQGPATELSSADISAQDLSLQLHQLDLAWPPPASSTPCRPAQDRDSSVCVTQSPVDGRGSDVASLGQSPEPDSRSAGDREWPDAASREAQCNTDTFYFISSTTRIHFTSGRAESQEQALPPRVTYDMIGGLAPQLAALQRVIELPLRQPQLFRSLGEEGPRPASALVTRPSLWCPHAQGACTALLRCRPVQEAGLSLIMVPGPERGEGMAAFRHTWGPWRTACPSLRQLSPGPALQGSLPRRGCCSTGRQAPGRP